MTARLPSDTQSTSTSIASLQELVDEDRLRARLARRFDRERDVRLELARREYAIIIARPPST